MNPVRLVYTIYPGSKVCDAHVYHEKHIFSKYIVIITQVALPTKKQDTASTPVSN